VIIKFGVDVVEKKQESDYSDYDNNISHNNPIDDLTGFFLHKVCLNKANNVISK
jgi:hypothetical protein